MPIDNTDTSAAMSSWSLFVAAMTTNQGLRSKLIYNVHNGMLQGTLLGSKHIPPAFAISYDTANGTALQGVSSPALGAVFAPLALKVPARTINPNGPPGNMNSPRKPERKIGTIVGGVIGGLAAIFAVISITAFVRRRRRRARPRSILSLSTDFREPGPELIVTPFDPYSYEALQDSRIFEEQQLLVTEGPETETVALHRLSSTQLAALPRPQPGTPVPVGLTDKEIARLRAEGLNSQQSRALEASSSNEDQSTSSPNTVPESREVPYDPRRLHSEVESLVRREMERLHVEGLVIGAPPSYATGDR